MTEAEFGKGTKLTRMLYGDRSGDYYFNEVLNGVVSVPQTSLLEEVDVSYSPFKGSLDFSNQPMVRRVYCMGSNVQSVSFADNGLLEEAYIGAVDTLSMNGLTHLKEFDINNDMLSKVNIINTPLLTKGLTGLQFFKKLPKYINSDLPGVRGYIDNIDLELSETDSNILEGFIIPVEDDT
jgi:hypothetical protein